MLWRARNNGLRRDSGTKGLSFPVELSHIKTSLESRIIFTIESEGESFMAWTDEQVFWRVDISEKLKPGIEKSSLVD